MTHNRDLIEKMALQLGHRIEETDFGRELKVIDALGRTVAHYRREAPTFRLLDGKPDEGLNASVGVIISLKD
jgi:hypothetical protein